MQKFQIKYLNHTYGLLVNISAFLIPLIFIALLAILKINVLFIIIISIILLITFTKVSRIILRNKAVFRKVIITDHGFGYEGENIIPWEQVKWYRIDTDKMDTFVVIVIGLIDKKTIKIPCYIKDKELFNLPELRESLSENFENNCPNLGNYFSSKLWDFIIITFIIGWILTPLLAYILDKDFLRILPAYLISIGAGITIIVRVKINRKK